MKKLKLVLLFVIISALLTSCSVFNTSPTSNPVNSDSKGTSGKAGQATDSQTTDSKKQTDNTQSNSNTDSNSNQTNPNQEQNGQTEQNKDAEAALKDPNLPSFEYPDAVRGIYVTANTTSVSRFQDVLKLLDETELNSMVIDIKDDFGYITFDTDDEELKPYSKSVIQDPKKLLEILAEHKIYPIARIVVFKDTVLATKHPEYSFLDNGTIWKNGRKEAFVNPFLLGVWEHNVHIAKLAAQLGFQEIQFDYVRFPEGFENKDYLKYSMGDYEKRQPSKFEALDQAYQEKIKHFDERAAQLEAEKEKVLRKLTELKSTQGPQNQVLRYEELLNNKNKEINEHKNNKPIAPIYSEYDRAVQLRVDAVTDFVAYARKELKPYDVKVSVDIFGYSATLPEAPGIGQNFSKISSNVDVISSMIYPSHWGNSYFGITYPDLHPYELIKAYSEAENEVLNKLGDKKPISRPWIQDFTAKWLGKGKYKIYGKADVEAQIKALHDSGINEFLIWNAGNTYSPNVDYTPFQ